MPKRLNISESFICRIWEGYDEYLNHLTADSGESVDIISIGKRNSDSGPDYKDAKIKIGDRTLAGDVEIHRDFKGWHQHSHKNDSAYNSVILQVVLWDESNHAKPKPRRKREIPTIVLSKHLKYSIHDIWQSIISNPSGKFRLQCYGLNSNISKDELNEYILRLAKARLELKSLRIKNRMWELAKEMSISSLRKEAVWNQALYEFMFEALGFSKNKEPMLKLSSQMTLKRVADSSNELSLKHIQSLLYGASGLLFDVRSQDKYIIEIKNIWSNVKEKLMMPCMNKAEWKFFPMRPANFPTIRLSYGAQIIKRILHRELLKNITSCFKKNKFNTDVCYKQLMELLEPEYDNYWSVNYNFGKRSKRTNVLLGKERTIDIITNVIIPLMYLYAAEFKDEVIKDNVLKFFRELKTSADNSVIRLIHAQVLHSRGLSIKTPAMEQGAIQLYNFYCTREKCRDCKIGKSVKGDEGLNYSIIFY